MIGRVFLFVRTYAYNIEILTKIMSMSDITSSCCHAEVPASNSSPNTNQLGILLEQVTTNTTSVPCTYVSDFV